MMVRLGRASDLHHLDAVLKEFEQISYSLWLDIRQWRRQTDFHRVAEKLGERSAQVLVYPEIYRLPHTTVRYNLLSVLAAGGCEVSILPGGDSRDRYLGIRGKLADAVRAGLTREAALKSLTLHPANLIGHGERIGSIEKGKDADLVFLDGDPLDPHSKVRRLMIRGEIVWDAQKDEN